MLPIFSIPYAIIGFIVFWSVVIVTILIGIRILQKLIIETTDILLAKIEGHSRPEEDLSFRMKSAQYTLHMVQKILK